jgi:hypothetical protein
MTIYGPVHFFRSHVRNFATITAPLNRLTIKEANSKDGDLPENCLENSIH